MIRWTFTPEFKQEALRKVVEQGRRVSQVALELSLRPGQIRFRKQPLVAQGAVAPPYESSTRKTRCAGCGAIWPYCGRGLDVTPET